MCITIANIYNCPDVHTAFVYAVSPRYFYLDTLPRVVTYFIRTILSVQTRFKDAKSPLESANITVFSCSLGISTFYNLINISD